MRRDSKFYVALFCILVGLSLLIYPSLANYINNQHSSKVIASYSDSVSDLSKDDFSFEWHEAQKHTEMLALQGFLAAGVDMEERDDLESYNRLLNVGDDGVMGVVRIPKIGVDLPVYHTAEESVLQRAVGHFVGSSLPIGGKSSHCILTGHRGLPSAELFTELDQLKKGDLFFIDVLNQTLAYKVDKMDTIDPESQEDAELLNVVPDKDLVTLLTCTPYGVNTHRLLVRGHRVKYVKKDEKKEVQKGEDIARLLLVRRFLILLIAIVVAIVAAVRIGLFLADNKKSRH